MANIHYQMCNMLVTFNYVAGDKLYDAFAHRHGRRHVTRAEYDQRTHRFHENKQKIEVVCFCSLLIRMIPSTLAYSAAAVPVYHALAFVTTCTLFAPCIMSLLSSSCSFALLSVQLCSPAIHGHCPGSMKKTDCQNLSASGTDFKTLSMSMCSRIGVVVAVLLEIVSTSRQHRVNR